ncbi:MAG: hypothetical protein BVN35_15410 [Proteobacteria bacterium ST_bin11]|jgi:lipopolysaccharide biosynthesis glycosyltransferase|nr:MAG: hypothetical protein BVN35_15410 [Proteobacteria bacterium ST_bin11]
MIDMMFSSARLFYPGAKTTILTNHNSNFDDISQRSEIVRFDTDASKLMLGRAIAQLDYVQNNLNENPMILVDSDILLNASLSPVFKSDFDVAVTWRLNEKMPINGGFIILNNVRPEVSLNFFTRFVAIYQQNYFDEAAWFGDQLALRDAIGINLHDYGENSIVDVEGCRILLLPCDVYNFSPRNQYSEINSNLSEKIVLHFKGERKRLMNHFWKAWLKPRNSFAPWVLFDAWRERRWLQQQANDEMLDISTKR